MLLSGKLTAHLNQIDQEVTEQVEVLMKQMAEKQGVNENLKRQDQMKWVRLMNNECQSQRRRNRDERNNLYVRIDGRDMR